MFFNFNVFFIILKAFNVGAILAVSGSEFLFWSAVVYISVINDSSKMYEHKNVINNKPRFTDKRNASYAQWMRLIGDLINN